MIVPGTSGLYQFPGDQQNLIFERRVIDTLKDVHNRGAEVYNQGDFAGAYRMYEGSLRTILPLLADHPQIQQMIESSLEEIAKLGNFKVQAFRLHEVIERVRTELKQVIVKAQESSPSLEMKDSSSAAGKKVTKETASDTNKTDPEFDVLPLPRPAVPKSTPTTRPQDASKEQAKKRIETDPLFGTITYLGKPVSDVDVIIASMDTPEPKTFSAKVNEDGKFRFRGGLPRGKYIAMIDDMKGKVPAKFGSMMSSGLRFELGEMPTELTWDLVD